MSMDSKIPDWLRSQCSRLRYKQCATRRCLIRGGYGGSGAVDLNIATCEAKEAYQLIGQIAALREASEEYLNKTEVFIKASVSGGFDDKTLPTLIKKIHTILTDTAEGFEDDRA